MTLERLTKSGWKKAVKVILKEGGLIYFGTGKLTGDISRSRFIK